MRLLLLMASLASRASLPSTLCLPSLFIVQFYTASRIHIYSWKQSTLLLHVPHTCLIVAYIYYVVGFLSRRFAYFSPGSFRGMFRGTFCEFAERSSYIILYIGSLCWSLIYKESF